MPKLVMDRLYRDLVRDIRTNYKIGETYLTLDQISARFKVSKLTAQRCIKKLAVRNMVQANPRSGIRIRSHEEGRDLAGRKIVMLTPYQDHKFSQAFLTGIQEAAEPAGIKAEHAVSQYPEQDTLGFGDYLLGLDADGVIALSFFGSALPFYHALTRGLDVVSDIHYPQLPILPVVETDNERHGRELGRRLAAGKFKQILAVGNGPLDDSYCRGFLRDRYRGFCRGLGSGDIKTSYVCVSQLNSMAAIDDFLYRFTPLRAVVTLDYVTNWLVASKFRQYNIKVENSNFIAYDGHDDLYVHKGLPPIPTVGPSLRKIGAALAGKLVRKWETGKFSEPLVEKI